MSIGKRVTWGSSLLAIGLLAGCFHDGDKTPPTYTLGGTVSGLTGTVTLANGGDTSTVSANGGFTFATPLTGGTSYNVTVTSQPTNQTCTVASGSGTIATSNVTTVAVTCVVNTFSVGGTVSGLVGSITLSNNGGDARTVTADGAYTFAARLTNGSAYNVAVQTQPANQDCTLSNAAGTIAAANVSNVAVSCTTIRVVASIGPAGGTVTGPGGAQLVIPAGALAQATDIGVARPVSGWPLPLPSDETLVGSIYEMTPHDLVFNKPVIIRLPVPAGAGNLGVLLSTPNEDWHHQDVLQNTDFIELERSSLSWYSGYALNGCAYNGPPRVGACTPSRGVSGRAWATATPANSIVMTSGSVPGIPVANIYSPTGSAGTWSVNFDTLQTLRLSMEFVAPNDCAAGHVQLRRRLPTGTTQVLLDQPTATSAGRGRASLDVPAAMLDEGLKVFYFRYGCFRSGSTRETAGGDWFAFDVRRAPLTGFTLGGTIAGLAVPGLQLQLARSEIVDVPAGATSFVFGSPLADGLRYEVLVKQQPQGASCAIANNTGTINAANVSNIAVTCTPTGVAPQIYTLVANGNTATLFGRQAGGASLTALDTKATGNTPVAAAATPFGPYFYVANLLGGFISPFRVDTTANTLATIALSSLNTPGPAALVVDPFNASFLWVANQSGMVSGFRIDAQTGQLSTTGTIAVNGAFLSTIAAHPNGNFVFVASQQSSSIFSYRVDRATGQLTSLGSLSNAVSSAIDLAIAPSGNFGYALSSTSGGISRLAVNAGTGQVSFLGGTTISGASNCKALVIHPNGSFLFATCSGAGALGSWIQTFAVNSTTGALTTGASTSVGIASPVTLALERGGLVLHAANEVARTVSTFSVDPANGTLTPTGSTATTNSPTAIASVP